MPKKSRGKMMGNKRLKGISIISAVLIALTGCGTQENGNYAVELNGNITNGYEWTYSRSDEGIVQEVSNTYEDTISGSEYEVGMDGTFSFEFKGVHAGEVTLTFQFARSWEMEKPEETKTIVLKVDDDRKITMVSEDAKNTEDGQNTDTEDQETQSTDDTNAADAENADTTTSTDGTESNDTTGAADETATAQ